MPYRAIVIGATGAVGGALVRELLASAACDGVIALTRRPIEGLPPPSHKLSLHVVNLTKSLSQGEGCSGADRDGRPASLEPACFAPVFW